MYVKNFSNNLTQLAFGMEEIIKYDGNLYLAQNYLPTVQANALLSALLKQLDWQDESIRIYGKTILSPRRVCWYGDPDAIYTYSGIRHVPRPWPSLLMHLREQLQLYTCRPFNAVLANLYRDNNDSMGWHADKEKELGSKPFIASISLGESRTFKIRHNKTKETTSIELSNGSLILMCGDLQKYWQHSVPKRSRAKSSRINLSFRFVYSEDTTSS